MTAKTSALQVNEALIDYYRKSIHYTVKIIQNDAAGFVLNAMATAQPTNYANTEIKNIVPVEKNFSLLTWNVSFSPHYMESRIAGIIKEIIACNADAVCLQEVNRPI